MYSQTSRLQKNNQNLKQPLILEIGEFSTKAGYSGEDKPSFIKPTVTILTSGPNIL